MAKETRPKGTVIDGKDRSGLSFLAWLPMPLWPAVRYALAIVIVAGAMALREALTAWVGSGLPPFITFYPALAVVALLAGFGPTLLATALMSGIAGYWYFPLIGSLDIASPVDRLALVIFIGMGVFLGVVAEIYRRNSRKAAYETSVRLNALYMSMTEGLATHEMVYAGGNAVDYILTDVNPAFERITGIAREQAVGARASALFGSGEPPYLDIYARVAESGSPETFETDFAPIGKSFHISVFSPGRGRFATVFEDITERKKAESNRNLTTDMLRILNQGSDDLHSMIHETLHLIQQSTGFDAVGLRLRDGDDFPYFEQRGFSDEFLCHENFVCERRMDSSIARNEDGSVRLECTCGLVLMEKTDPSLPFFTEGGSCWTNRSNELLAIPTEEDPRDNPRNRCIHSGYQSVALIPVKSGGMVMGLLQLNGHREGMFTLDTVRFYEALAANIGLALSRKRAEEALQKAHQELQIRAEQLRSANEELAVLNESAETANAELAASNDDLQHEIAERKWAEEALRQSREDMARAQEVGQIGSWRLDVRRNVLTWSDENYRIFGVPQGTLLTYETFLGIVHPDDRQYVDTQWNAGLRGEPYDIEHRIVVDGQVKWVREKAYLEFDDGELLGGFGITQDITERKLLEQQKEELYRREHHISEVLQQALIPSQIPYVACYQFVTRYVPALHESIVGGDFYDVFELGDGKVAVLIGDVVGKGVLAAIQVSAARYAFRSYAYTTEGTAGVVSLVNDALCRNQDASLSNMLTAFFAVVDTHDHTVTYTNAGHEPPVVRRADGGMEELTVGARALGVMPGCDYPEEKIAMEPGDLIVMLTDGITEARSPEHGMLGKDGMLRLLAEAHASPSELVDRLLDKARHYGNGSLHDDVAIVVFGLESSCIEAGSNG